MGIWYRPLLFASIDPETAEARGVRVRRLGLIFLLVLALTVTGAAQVVGTLLVLSLAITPAAAQRLSASPLAIGGLSVLFAVAVAAADGGLLVSFDVSNMKASVFITSLSFAIYLLARLAGPMLAYRARHARRSRLASRRRYPRGAARPKRAAADPGRISNRAALNHLAALRQAAGAAQSQIAGPREHPPLPVGWIGAEDSRADPIQVIGEPPGIHGAGAHPPSSRRPQPGCWATARNNAACGGSARQGDGLPPGTPQQPVRPQREPTPRLAQQSRIM